MNVLVVYYSRSGHTRAAAEAIAQAARTLHHDTVLKSVIELQPSDVAQADVLFIGTWVHGLILFGVKPAGADLWVPSLPSLAGKPVAVFCTYAFNPRRSLRSLGTQLEAKGATVVGQHAFHRRRPGQGADAFVERVVQAVEPAAR